MNFLQQALDFIFTAANWGGPAGLAARIVEHPCSTPQSPWWPRR